MASASGLSIVIVSWNTRGLTIQCLKSLQAAGYLDCAEIIVVDNHSTDGSVDALVANFPEVRLLVNEDNRGFAAANNQALRRCARPYVLLLNPDTEVRAGQLEAMIAHLEAQPACGMVGPKLLNPDGSVQVSALRQVEAWDLYYEYARFPRGLQPRAQLKPRRLIDLSDTGFTPVEYVSGAALMLRQTVLQEVGLLDEGFFMYAEELDWCWRARALGWRVDYLPTAEVTHHGGQSAKLVASRMLAQRYVSSLRLIAKYQGRSQVWLARALLLLASLQNATWETVRYWGGRQPRTAYLSNVTVAWLLARVACLGRVSGKL